MKHALMVIGIVLFATTASGQTATDFFNEDILHEIHLDVHPNDWQSLKDHFRENTHYPADMHWKFNGRFTDIQQVSIRSRGTGSRTPIKPGLLVDFDRYNAGQRFLGLRSVVLRNNAQDASMMHERVAFALMRRLGMNAPRVAHVRLYVNGLYLGLYAIVENIDEPFLKDRFGSDSGYLYEFNWSEPSYFFEYRGSDSSLYSPVPFQPQTHEDKPNAERIEAMVWTINHASDAEFERAVGQYLDWGDFIQEIAAEAYIAESDGMLGEFGLNNFYIYRPQDSSPFRIMPWDKSQAFTTLDRSIWRHIGVNVLSRRAFAVPALRAAFIDAVSRAANAAGGPGGWLEQEIIKEYNQIRDATLQDENKLCDPPQSGVLLPCSNETFEEHVANMIRFARTRNQTVAQQLAEVPAF
jgi:spore coat protein CotH